MSRHTSELLALLDRIEAEMKRVGLWSSDPPDLLADVEAGRIKTYLDVPTFELWLQCVFIPNARDRVLKDELPRDSQVGVMAMRNFDGHMYEEATSELLRLLNEFDSRV